MKIITWILLLTALATGQPPIEWDGMHTPRNIQSPNVASDFWAQWNSSTPRITLCVLVTPQTFWTGVSPIGFTSNTRNMTLPGHPGVTFYASPGMTPTAVEQALGETANLEMMGVYQSGLFEQADVLAGKWNFAQVEIFSVSWEDTDLGELVHFVGNLGEFKDYQLSFNAEGRGLIGRLSNDVNKVTQRHCRVKAFGDSECGKSLAGTVDLGGTAYDIQQTGVTAVRYIDYEALVFDTSTWSGNVPADQSELEDLAAGFVNGTLLSTDGDNSGISREIADANGNPGFPNMAIWVKRAFPYEIPFATSKTFTATMGCDRTPANCTLYGNIINFRGEPFVPGIESTNRIPPAS